MHRSDQDSEPSEERHSPAFSVIVPVFNAAPFLRECLDSIRKQTTEDWECICVDDGSTDDSPAILDDYAARDRRFRIFHQPNQGESSARNHALDEIAGTWFTFVDADDAIVPDALECFRRALAEFDADALLCYPEDRFLGIEDYRTAPPGYRLLARDQAPVEMLAGPFSAHGYTVSKTYRTALFRTVRFPVGVRVTPDTRFWADALCVPARWAVIDKPYYAYRIHPGAVTSTKDFRFYRECIESYGYVFRAMSERMKATRSDVSRYAARYRTLHSHMAYNAFREWRSYTRQERRRLFETVADACAAASPVFPFRLTTRLRLYGWHTGLAPLFVLLANFIDRIELSVRYRWGRFLAFLGLRSGASSQ